MSAQPIDHLADTQPLGGPGQRTDGAASFGGVVAAIAARGIMRMRRLPSILVPAIVMPMFFLVSYAGTFSSVTQIEGFGTDSSVSWFTAYSIIMGASFAGTGAAGAAATDLENGFFDRLRLSPVSPLAIVLGLCSYSIIRALIPTTAVLILAALMGANFSGGVVGVLLAYVAAVGVASVIGLMGMAVAFKFKTVQSLSMIQIVIFTFTFLSVGQAPLVAIEGWLKTVARWNPMSPIMRMARQGFVGDVTWGTTWPGLVSLLALCVVFAALAVWQLQGIEE